MESHEFMHIILLNYKVKDKPEKGLLSEKNMMSSFIELSKNTVKLTSVITYIMFQLLNIGSTVTKFKLLKNVTGSFRYEQFK